MSLTGENFDYLADVLLCKLYHLRIEFLDTLSVFPSLFETNIEQFSESCIIFTNFCFNFQVNVFVHKGDVHK